MEKLENGITTLRGLAALNMIQGEKKKKISYRWGNLLIEIGNTP